MLAEGLIDADARIQERMEELERERARARAHGRARPGARARARVAEARAHGTPAAADRDGARRRRAQIAQAIEEVDRRMAEIERAAHLESVGFSMPVYRYHDGTKHHFQRSPGRSGTSTGRRSRGLFANSLMRRFSRWRPAAHAGRSPTTGVRARRSRWRRRRGRHRRRAPARAGAVGVEGVRRRGGRCA